MECEGGSPQQSESIHSGSLAGKKPSPLKHVTPIIKKYDSQRQSKSNKLAVPKSHENTSEDLDCQNKTPVQDLVAGMDSLDAALRRAEKCIAGSKEGFGSEVDAHGDDILGEEEGISSTSAALNVPNCGSIRSNHPRARNRVLKKRNQLKKDLEHALPLAASDQPLFNDKRSEGYATSFFIKVKQRYEETDHSVLEKFMELLYQFDNQPHHIPDLFHRVFNLLQDSPDLCEEFLLFLLPQQALACGKFMEHLAVTEMIAFLEKLEKHFEKQPQHSKKILAAVARFAESPDVTLESVRSTLLPLLRGNGALADAFLQLLPSERPPESKMTDFAQMHWEEVDGEHSADEETFERIEIPPETDDRYGGDACECCCHKSTVPAFSNHSKHCELCGLKFIAGKVFMQTEHGLRPVRIVFRGSSTIHNLKRLNAGPQKLSRPRSRRGRVNASQTAKLEEFKQSGETDDEAVFLSKIKSPRQRLKISKPNREKPPSARSLPLNQSSRKSVGGSLGSPPLSVIHDQETIHTSTLSPSGDQKPTTLDDPKLLIQGDQGDTAIESVNQSPLGREQLKEDEIKEECGTEREAVSAVENSIVGKASSDSGRRAECLGDVKIEDGISEDVSVEEMDQRDVGDDDNGSNVDVLCASSDCEMEEASENKESSTWTREEDRIILCTFQTEPDRGKTFSKMSAQLPHRTLHEISSRFQELMKLIQQMR